MPAGSWQLDGTGSIVTTQAADMTLADLVMSPSFAGKTPTFETGFTIVVEASAAESLNRYIDATFTSSSHAMACVLKTNGATGPMILQFDQTFDGAYNPDTAVSPGLPEKVSPVWWYTLDPTAGSCLLNGLANTDPNPPATSATRLDFHVSNFTISLQYVLVYTVTQ